MVLAGSGKRNSIGAKENGRMSDFWSGIPTKNRRRTAWDSSYVAVLRPAIYKSFIVHDSLNVDASMAFVDQLAGESSPEFLGSLHAVGNLDLHPGGMP